MPIVTKNPTALLKALKSRIAMEKAIIGNTIALGIVQVVTLLTPLLTFPYLTRVLGPEPFGMIAIAMALIAYVQIVCDWGFGWSGTKAIAKSDSILEQKAIIWSVSAAKIFIFLALLAVVTIVYSVAPQPLTLLVLLLMSLAVTGTLNPLWIFQGLEAVKGYSMIAVACRLLSVPTTFLLIHTPDDLYNVPLCYAAGPAAASIAGWFLLIRNHGGKQILSGVSEFISPRSAINQIRAGAPYFMVTASQVIYGTSAVLICGLLLGPASAGLFAAADRIRQAIQAMIRPISQVVYPRMARLYVSDPRGAASTLWMAAMVLTITTSVVAVVLTLRSSQIMALVAGADFQGSGLVLAVLAWVPLISGLGTVFGAFGLVAAGLASRLGLISLAAIPVAIVSATALSMHAGVVGAALSVLVTEAFILAISALVFFRSAPLGRARLPSKYCGG